MSNSGCLMFNQVCLAQMSGWCQARPSVLHSLVHPTVQTHIEHHESHCSGRLKSSKDCYCLQVRLSKDAMSWDHQGQLGLAVFPLGVHPLSQGPVDVSVPLLGTGYSQCLPSLAHQGLSVASFPPPRCVSVYTFWCSKRIHHPLRSRNRLPCSGSQTMANLMQALPALDFLSSPD